MICNKLTQCYKKRIYNKVLSDCSNPNVKCVLFSDDISRPKCEEKGKTYILDNTMNNHVVCFKVDGGIIADDKNVPQRTERCDYMFCINNHDDLCVILIELKGTNVSKALEQLHKTCELYKDFLKSFPLVVCRAIVTNSVPKIKSAPEYVKLWRCLSSYNGNSDNVKMIHIEERNYTEKDTDILK